MAEKEREISGLNLPEDEEEEELSQEELMELYAKSMGSLEEGKVVKGSVVKLSTKEAVIDVGLKSEGIVPLSEFKRPEDLKVGDEVEVFLEETEDDEGFAVLSKQKADFLRVWDHIKSAYDNGTPVEGIISRRVRGGMIVDLLGVDAFLPGSQIDLHPVKDMDRLVGSNHRFKIIKLNWKRRNIVVSRRTILEEEREEARAQLLKELEVGQVREGVVKNITDFGAFVDLGGVDGLLHITDMSWGRVIHPSELVAMGDKIRTKVIGIDHEKMRVSLGMKQLTEYPWENIEKKYPVGSKVRGKVVSITDYGAFVELEKGVEGLIHISEMAWTRRIHHPSQVVAIGDVLEAVVLTTDKENERISLGLKQTVPDPWETLEERYPAGTVLTGKVRTITNFGAFVEIEDGIDGLVHISDMSWTRRINHPSEVVKKGEKVDVVVLAIDKENRRISLGMKQAKKDPLEEFTEEHEIGKEMTGKVEELLEQGLIVELDGDVRGFVPFSHLVREGMSVPADKYGVGEELSLVLIEVNTDSRRVVLSEKAYYQPKSVTVEETPKETRPRLRKRRERKKTKKRGDEEEAYEGEPR
jgi:small subunit ribosomal protein S1